MSGGKERSMFKCETFGSPISYDLIQAGKKKEGVLYSPIPISEYKLKEEIVTGMIMPPAKSTRWSAAYKLQLYMYNKFDNYF